MVKAYFVIRLGFEPKTHSLEGCCSIQLSYQTILFGCKDTAFFQCVKRLERKKVFKMLYSTGLGTYG